VGEPYYDESFKGYVIRAQSEQDPNQQIIVPSYEAVCKIIVIDKTLGTTKEYPALIPDTLSIPSNFQPLEGLRQDIRAV
jgi:hypothetical protein